MLNNTKVRQCGFNTQQDPIGIAGGLNPYGYANGDPINFSDPFGIKAEDCDPIRNLASGRPRRPTDRTEDARNSPVLGKIIAGSGSIQDRAFKPPAIVAAPPPHYYYQ